MTKARRRNPPGGLTRGRRWMVSLVGACVSLGAAALVLAAWALWSYQGPGPKAPSGEVVTVVLRQGAGLSEIAATLERKGVVRSSSLFMAAAQLSGSARELKAGEYAIPSGASMAKILRAIRDGDVVRHLLTIPEGFTSEMAAEALRRTPELVGDAPEAPEGAILPDTYHFQRGDDRAAVLKRMMDARDQTLATLWAKRQPGLPFSTPEEAVTLASIVEKETAIAAERPRIAAVFVNRLRAGMRLESDPTIIYGVSGGRPLGRGIRQSELTGATPYNTYVIPGLPPTPICNPGRAALAAVLDPPKTTELFFVADGSGGHIFATSFAEHRKNVENWRKLERARAAVALTPGQAPAR